MKPIKNIFSIFSLNLDYLGSLCSMYLGTLVLSTPDSQFQFETLIFELYLGEETKFVGEF